VPADFAIVGKLFQTALSDGDSTGTLVPLKCNIRMMDDSFSVVVDSSIRDRSPTSSRLRHLSSTLQEIREPT
jgi:hypothetical protein